MIENTCGPSSPERFIERIQEYRKCKFSTNEIPLVVYPGWYFGITSSEGQNIHYFYLINTPGEIIPLDVQTSRIIDIKSYLEEHASQIQEKIKAHAKYSLEKAILES